MTKVNYYDSSYDAAKFIDELIHKYGFDNVKYSVTYDIVYHVFYTIRDNEDEKMKDIS